MLGLQLHPKVVKLNTAKADKITGMLLELDVPDALHLLETPDALQERVREAIEVLEEHEATVEPRKDGNAGQKLQEGNETCEAASPEK